MRAPSSNKLVFVNCHFQIKFAHCNEDIISDTISDSVLMSSTFRLNPITLYFISEIPLL